VSAFIAGSISDGGVWSNSTLGTILEEGQGDLPPPKPLPNSNIVTHHAFVGDEAFPLKTYLLRPYARNNLQDAERVFNYRLSRARRVIENTFGILVTRWQIYHKMIGLSPESVCSLIRGTVCLHNFLMAFDEDDPQSGDKRYCPSDLLDRENQNHEVIQGLWRRNHVEGFMGDLGRAGANNRSQNATAQRDSLRDYFVSPVGESQAPWQYTTAFRGLEVDVPEQV